ncbi:MAG: LysR family transcriptional regulator, partial [Pyramidobacter sp.]|nr:LysR family transcriptional regulator [Pyramidobacter sp.]
MTLLQIQYALECYATGSLSKAAQNLFTSVSNLSKTLHALEDELGCELFVRTSSGVTPT